MRVKLSTLIVVSAAVAGLGAAAFLMFRDSPGSANAYSGGADRAVAGRKARSLPRFNSHPEATERPAPPSFAQPPPPTFTPPEPAELKERASKDGFLYREAGKPDVFVVQGGTRYYIRSGQEFEALGYKWDQIEEVPAGSLRFLNERPAEGTLLRERDSAAVFIYENGQKRFITSPKVFERMGKQYSDIKVIPAGGLGRETAGASVY